LAHIARLEERLAGQQAEIARLRERLAGLCESCASWRERHGPPAPNVEDTELLRHSE
jgi:hypothetical protein